MFVFVLHDMVKKTNCLLASFPRVGPFILTRLFQSYCLSLYGSALWSLSCPALHLIEVAFNRVLGRIWRLPYRSHTGIVHLVANLDSLLISSFVGLILFGMQLPSVPLHLLNLFSCNLPLLVILTLDTTLCLVRVI